MDELERAGAVKLRRDIDYREEFASGILPQRDVGIVNYSSSRALLENLIRQKVTAIPNVILRDHCRVLNVSADDQHAEITLVDALGNHEVLPADLVVDASSRGNLTMEYLERAGIEPPAQSKIGIDVGYSTAIFELPASTGRSWSAVATRPSPPTDSRAGQIGRGHV